MLAFSWQTQPSTVLRHAFLASRLQLFSSVPVIAWQETARGSCYDSQPPWLEDKFETCGFNLVAAVAVAHHVWQRLTTSIALSIARSCELPVAGCTCSVVCTHSFHLGMVWQTLRGGPARCALLKHGRIKWIRCILWGVRGELKTTHLGSLLQPYNLLLAQRQNVSCEACDLDTNTNMEQR